MVTGPRSVRVVRHVIQTHLRSQKRGRRIPSYSYLLQYFALRFNWSNRNSDAGRNSLQSDRPSTYTSNVTAAPTYDSAHGPNDRVRAWRASVPSASVCSDPDSGTLLDGTESSVTDTISVAETSSMEATTPTGPRYIYYRVYAENGVLPSKTPATADDSFLGRVNATFVPPPHTVLSVRRSIAKVEDISDRTPASLFLTLDSPSPMDDTSKVTILDRAGTGSMPQEPPALVAKLSDSERSALESGRRSEDVSTLEPGSTSPNNRYLYYRLYTSNFETPSRMSFDLDEPSLGCICTDSIAPPHTPASMKRCISRVEENPALVYADLFVNISCDTPLTEGHISILHSDGPGLTPDEPIGLVNPFTQRMRASRNWAFRSPPLLDVAAGDTFYADSKPTLVGDTGYTYKCYRVASSAGKTGFVVAGKK